MVDWLVNDPGICDRRAPTRVAVAQVFKREVVIRAGARKRAASCELCLELDITAGATTGTSSMRAQSRTSQGEGKRRDSGCYLASLAEQGWFRRSIGWL